MRDDTLTFLVVLFLLFKSCTDEVANRQDIEDIIKKHCDSEVIIERDVSLYNEWGLDI